MSWKECSIFGSSSVPVVVTTRSSKPLSLAGVSRVLEEAGAIVNRRSDESGGLSCELPAGRFVGFGYVRSLTLPCQVTIQLGSKSDVVVVTAECDAARLRRSKRRLFYFWSVFFGLIGVVRMMSNGWDVATAVFMGLPWPAVEANFLYDRWRLREKMRRSLVRMGEEYLLTR